MCPREKKNPAAAGCHENDGEKDMEGLCPDAPALESPAVRVFAVVGGPAAVVEQPGIGRR
jgi:hypothetical protein